MKVTNRRVEMADGSIRHVTLIRDEQAPPEERDHRRLWFLQTLVDSPSLLRCGPMAYASMHVSYADQAWQAQLEAIEGRKA